PRVQCTTISTNLSQSLCNSFLFIYPATTESSTLSLHDALPISLHGRIENRTIPVDVSMKRRNRRTTFSTFPPQHETNASHILRNRPFELSILSSHGPLFLLC